MSRKLLSAILCVALVVLIIPPATAGTSGASSMVYGADNPNPPSNTTKLVFIHHSCGENWLKDGNGGLGGMLQFANYFVSDTNYGWGLNGIGNDTDIGQWWSWFRGPDSAAYTAALYNESGQNSAYSRLPNDPGGENKVIMFKSCYPNSNLTGDPNAPVPDIGSNPLKGQDCYSGNQTVANAKGIYIDLLEYFKTRTDKLFIAVTAPPLMDATYSSNARAFNNWLVNDWLDGYAHNNVFVFDFYNVLTSNGGGPYVNDIGQETGNHHRWYNDAVQHKTDGGGNTAAYADGDDHPTPEGNQKGTAEFAPLLNVAHNRFTGEDPDPPPPPPPGPTTRQCAHDSVGVTAPNDTWYLAEGCTNGGFETWVLVQNPGNETACVDLTFMTDEGEVAGPSLEIDGGTRETVNVADTVQTFNVSTKVDSDKPVVAERSVYYNNRTCAHDSIGVTAPNDTWYLAEGCTAGGFETWVLVQNPGEETACVDLTFMTDTGEQAGPTLVIDGGSRETVNVADSVQTFNVSTKVDSDKPVVAERAVYYNNRTCAHDSIGVTTPNDTWYLAEGCTAGGFETWVLVQNPGEETACVNLTFMTDTGEQAGPSLLIDGGSRETVNVADSVQTFNVSTKVDSDKPVVAERAVYYNNRTCAHDSVGVTAPNDTWYLAEGCTDGGFETWVLVQNPGNETACVDLTFMTDNGEVDGPYLEIDGGTRQSVNVADTVQTFNVSTLVSSDVPVVAERSMYYNNRTCAHDSIGVTAPNDTWYLAEGCTDGGFETWILVQNPGDTAATVNLTFMTDEGEVAGPTLNVDGGSRESVNVASTIQTYNVSTKVDSTKPVVVERSMYYGL